MMNMGNSIIEPMIVDLQGPERSAKGFPTKRPFIEQLWDRNLARYARWPLPSPYLPHPSAAPIPHFPPTAVPPLSPPAQHVIPTSLIESAEENF
ncbi:hypothetical protein BT96DRAFT_1027538 [Gymnopus androsaceus JB14]|uniref:Uncharacterized protein n=1 Tax=Gymnopus androsaceus JB14 TaxID=1447944 RepID=A0A6A4GB64_9AGAR|nr:hypothetical protein BT96DRAFT_1027538 [Gymnopus androsaceus JB14]